METVRGYSMTELVLALGLVTTITVGGLVFGSRLKETQRIDEAADDLRALAMAVESAHAVESDFSMVDTASSVLLAPDNMKQGAGGLALRGVGDSVTLSPVAFSGPPTKPSFAVTVSGLSNAECSKLAAAASPWFKTIRVGGADVLGNPEEAARLCSGGSNAVAFERERGAMALKCVEKSKASEEACPSGGFGKVYFIERYTCPTGFEPGVWGARQETGRTCVGAAVSAPADVCSNLEGDQASVPDGWTVAAGKCCPTSTPVYRFPPGTYKVAVPACSTQMHVVAQAGGGGGASTQACTGYGRGGYGAAYDPNVWRGDGCCGAAGGGGGGGGGRVMSKAVAEGDWVEVRVGRGGAIDADGADTVVMGKSAPVYEGGTKWTETLSRGRRGTINPGGAAGGDFATPGMYGSVLGGGTCPPSPYQTQDCVGGYSPVVTDPVTGTSSGGDCLGWSLPYWVYPAPPTFVGGEGGYSSVGGLIAFASKNLSSSIKTGWPDEATFSLNGDGGIGGGVGPAHANAFPGKDGYAMIRFDTAWPEKKPCTGLPAITVFRYAGNIDHELKLKIKMATTNGNPYVGSGGSGTLQAGVAATGGMYQEVYESMHGDLVGNISYTPVKRADILKMVSASVSFVKVSGNVPTISVAEQPSRENGWVASLSFYTPSSGEQYVDGYLRLNPGQCYEQ